jgi:hypothetical protein
MSPTSGSETAAPSGAMHGDVLRRKMALASGQLRGAAERFWSQPDLAQRYPELLFQLHCVVRASVPGMEMARRHAEEHYAGDPVGRAVAAYMTRHIPEELHHDEWLLDDLEELGVSREMVLRRVPSSVAANLVGSVYYWVLHAHPVAFMGYVAALEGYPPSADFLVEIAERTRLPRAGFRTYLKHAQLDPHHSRENFAALDQMPLTDGQIALVGVVAYQTLRHVAALFESLTGSPIPDFGAGAISGGES